MVYCWLPYGASAQYVHPPAPPTAQDFDQPPAKTQARMRGPQVTRANVRCWGAEPEAPTKFFGGVHDFQNVSVFVPLEPLLAGAEIDTTFRQDRVRSLDRGGADSPLTVSEVPPGLFVSIRGHPVFKVIGFKFPSQSASPAPGRKGVTINIAFRHEPNMGECYLDVAVWVAVKQN
jgi:hypothetical protein